MKKYIYVLLTLSAAGACISALLLIQHFYPDTEAGTLFCGNGMVNSCISLGQSGYATLFTIPLAAYGLFYYLFLLFTLLVTDYAGETYHAPAAALLLPVCLLGLAADAALTVILVLLQQFCALCIATYLINIMSAAALYFWYRAVLTGPDRSLFRIPRVLMEFAGARANRGFIAAFTLFTVFLLFDVFSTSTIMDMKSGADKISGKRITSYVNRFYTSKMEEPVLPESGLRIGNPDADITLVVFTDFLCSACYRMFKTEKYLFSKFPGRLRIVYYHYPLDMDCNDSVTRTVYPESCVASRAISAASELGILEQYQMRHFRNYGDTRSDYGPDTAMRIFRETVKESGLDHISGEKFREIMNSEKTGETIRLHCRTASDIGIKATPTLFLEGRRLIGAPPAEVLSAIISIELEKKSP